MLSIANPLDPSYSSSKVLELGADEKVSEQLTLQKADLEVGLGETQTLHFSIRDYVFASRRKDISTNWPFPRQLMQLCLKHGIQDLLPPFQPPSAVIAHCLSNPIVQVSHEARTNSPHIGETLLLDEEPNSIDLIPSCSAKVEEDNPDELMHVEHEIGSAVTIHRDIEVIKPQLGEPVVNKCKLILKTQASRLEEFASSYLASEIMTPKVCPVCKMFSSTSNTTLNAHMDQCLSMESESTLVEDKNAKSRVKPRKKRFLEEIYATSTCCSLEDLDRRNGSSWVKDLTLVTPETENSDASIVEKKLQSSQLLTKDDKDEGAVYVDSNGVKLRILSKFDDAPRATSEAFEPMKNGKGIGDGSLISANNKHVGVMCSREMEMSQKNKKLSSSNLFKDKETLGVSYHEESQQKDGSPVLLSSMKDQYHMSFASATLRRWSCSKRSNLSKKNTQKDLSKSLENSKLVHQTAMVDSRKTACSTSSAAECHPTELSESPNSKFVHIPLNTIQNKENHEKGSQRSSLEVTSRNILLLQLPKASAGNMKSCMRKRETKPQDSCGIGRTLTGTSHFPQKTKRVSTLSNAKSNIRLLHDNLQLVQTDKRKLEFSFKGNGEQPRCGEADLLEFPMEEVVTQSLHAGSSMCQDCEPKDSNKPFENMTSVSAFLRKAEDSSIITGSAGSDDHGILLDSYDEEGATNATDGYSIPVEEVSQDKPGEQATKLEHRNVESQDQATYAQELSVNIVSPTDQGTCFPRESSSTSSHPVSPVEKHDPVISREPFVSASIASTISPAFLMDSKCEATRSKPVSRSPTINRHLNLPLPSIISKEGTQEIEIGLSQQVQNDFAERKPQQPSNYQPCHCAWQDLVTGKSPNLKSKMYQNLHVRPISSSSSSSSFGAHSSFQTNAANTQSLESPTGSTLTRACSEVGTTSPSCGTPTQSSSNSILRLMGKNLMVMHLHEESAQLPKVHSTATDDNSSIPLLPSSPACLTPYVSASNHGVFFSSVVHSPATLNCLPHVQQNNVNHRLFMNKEVIDTHSLPDGHTIAKGTLSNVPVSNTMFQSTFDNQLLASVNGFSPSYLIKKGTHMEFPTSLLPSPLLFRSPSTSHLSPPFCYPQSLR